MVQLSTEPATCQMLLLPQLTGTPPAAASRSPRRAVRERLQLRATLLLRLVLPAGTT